MLFTIFDTLGMIKRKFHIKPHSLDRFRIR